MRSRSPFPRRTVSTGLASRPLGSLADTPIRTVPTSSPILTPARMMTFRPTDRRLRPMPRSAAGGRLGDCALDAVECCLDGRDIGPAALGHVVLAAASAAKYPGSLADQRAGAKVPLASPVVDRNHDERPVGQCRGGCDNRRPVVAEPPAHIKRQFAEVVRGRAIRCAMPDKGNPGDIPRALR